ncbi:MAG TPA: YceD family protein [Gammaproteobacteria bacterium]|nr:YceD family protein [Gammaproteobacteria bacterium]
MRDKLRRRYQVDKEVTRNGYFEGEIALSELTRLNDLLYREFTDREDRKIAVRFEFLRNEYGVSVLVGRLRANLELECQRCLEALEMPVELDFELMIDAGEVLLRDSSLDSIDSEDGYIDIYAVVEDEMMLALPLVAMHENTACNEHWPAAENEFETGNKDNPFAVLEKLKTTD